MSAFVVGLKIWRYDAVTGDKKLREYEVDAPVEATLLDVLDIVKDRVDGSLAYRKSCRMMICGSCGMRMDGAAVLACKTRMYDIAQAGHVPVVSAMGNLPVIKDLVVDMEPFFDAFRAVKPFLITSGNVPTRERIQSQTDRARYDDTTKCILCACCTTSCPVFWNEGSYFGPAAIVNAHRFIFDSRDEAAAERLPVAFAAAQLHRLDLAGERLEGNVSPELVIDALAVGWSHAGGVRGTGGAS